MSPKSTWGQAVQSSQWEDVAAVLGAICAHEFTRPPEDPDPITLDMYHEVWEQLRALAPEHHSWVLHIEGPDECGDPRRLYSKQPDEPADVYAEDPEDPEIRWAPYVLPWTEWLGARVIAPAHMPVAAVVAHGMAELTWGGWHPGEQGSGTGVYDDGAERETTTI